MKIVDYSACADKAHWLTLIKSADWGAAEFLVKLLSEINLKKCVEKTREFCC